MRKAKIKDKIVKFFGYQGSNVGFKHYLHKLSDNELLDLYYKTIQHNISTFNKQYRVFCILIFKECRNRELLK